MPNFDFFKYEGLGNDFIIVFHKPNLNSLEIKKLCDRHFGIGADGLIFIFEDNKENSSWHVKFFNADGSLAKMCGNGLRCAAEYLRNQKIKFSEILTDSGPKSCQYDFEKKLWELDLGIATINKNKINIGNEHLIIEGDFDPSLDNSETNIIFFKIITPNEVKIRTLEKGVGETLACGTGSCAVTAYLVNNKKLNCDEEITVHLNAGKLYTRARRTNARLALCLKGPAQFVFHGTI